MMTFFLVICCATALLGVGIVILLIGSYLLGRPLSKGCGKSDCCRKKACDKQTPPDSTTKASPHDDNTPSHSA
ncbi:hypothetical protein [Chlamydia abortus]|uniref:hypothetical protein n=1 Tax=Chlamydia abortus TaxID=83555 RepID=UPI00029CB810|nr:hypothetical protein [Chlamydia abortus]ASD30412.1 hypothetical protein CEF07_01240 [Chlamydia abortus]AUS59667.1 uncharacterized protein CHAB577_0246 [Chlamydia abortus]EGK69007.1 hypothetical protein CAB1_0241 [Chlamydia abortus LLG]QEM73608.1 hypothetical protein DZK34_01240 [Chlamydia abortus]CAG9046437.1 hypothetical protein NVRI1_00799 [Chlamydia abortus]